MSNLKKLEEQLGEVRRNRLTLGETVQSRDKAIYTEQEIAQDDEWAKVEADLAAEFESGKRLELVKRSREAATVEPSAPAYTPVTSAERVTRSKANQALAGWLTRGRSIWQPEFREAGTACGFDTSADSHRLNLYSNAERVTRTSSGQVIGNAARGGNYVPGLVIDGLEKAIGDVWPWQSICTVDRTLNGNLRAVETHDDTGNRAVLTGEKGSITTVDTTFDKKQLSAFKYTSQVNYSTEFLEDIANDDAAGLLAADLGARMGRAIMEDSTTGGGTTLPRGFTLDTTEGVQGFYRDGFTDAEVLALMYSVKDEFANSPGTAFMCNRQVLPMIHQLGNGVVSQITDIQGRLVPTLHGYPVYTNPYLNTLEDDGEPVLYFGDFKKVKYRLVRDMVFKSFAEKDDSTTVQVLFRWDSLLVSTGAPIKYLALGGGSAPSMYDTE